MVTKRHATAASTDTTEYIDRSIPPRARLCKRRLMRLLSSLNKTKSNEIGSNHISSHHITPHHTTPEFQYRMIEKSDNNRRFGLFDRVPFFPFVVGSFHSIIILRPPATVHYHLYSVRRTTVNDDPERRNETMSEDILTYTHASYQSLLQIHVPPK